MKMHDKVQGFILKQMDYQDSSSILTVLTKEYGKLSIVARGVKKMTSKNASKTLPFTLVEFLIDYKENHTMFTMQQATCIQMYKHMHMDLQKSTVASIMAEIVDDFVVEESASYYRMLFEAYEALEQDTHIETVLALFLVEEMKEFGIEADVDECVHCGKKQVVSISSEQGGFLCKDCATLFHSKIYELEDLKRFRLLCKASLKQYNTLIQYTKATMQDIHIFMQMITLHTGLRIRAYALYEKLF